MNNFFKKYLKINILISQISRLFWSDNYWPRRSILLILDTLIIYYLCNFADIIFKPERSVSIEYISIFLVFVSLIVYFLTDHYRGITRYESSLNFYKLSFINTLIIFISFFFLVISGGISFNSKFIFSLLFLMNVLVGGIRFILRDILLVLKNNKNKKRILIYGAGESGLRIAQSMRYSKKFNISYLADDNKFFKNQIINNIKIISGNEIYRICKDKLIDEIWLSKSKHQDYKIKEILEIINKNDFSKIKVLKVPSLEDLPFNQFNRDTFTSITTSDLLNRKIVKPDWGIIQKGLNDKVICISGGGGSIGSELLRQLTNINPKKVIIVENNEYNLYKIKDEIDKEYPDFLERIKTFLGDVGNKEFINNVFKRFNVDIVFHAAAYKHVPILEENSNIAVRNNIFATKNICELSIANKVSNFIFISTDKAVRPSSLMGATKRVAEMIIQDFSDKNIDSNTNVNTKFSIVRFGNVLGSSGSVVPLFQKQINTGGPLTITHPEVTRFFMTIPEAAQLVLQASCLSYGGDLFLLDMGKPVKILELAKQMIKLNGLNIKNSKDDISGNTIEILYTGLRPGEKLYEELLIDSVNEKTVHPRIYRAYEPKINSLDLQQKLLNLESRIDDFNDCETKKILKQLVPEWIN